MANKKLKQEDLRQLLNLQERKQAATLELGRLEESKIEIENRRAEILQFKAETRSLETQLANYFESTYGKGSIDVEKGVFIPIPNTAVKEVEDKKAPIE